MKTMDQLQEELNIEMHCLMNLTLSSTERSYLRWRCIQILNKMKWLSKDIYKDNDSIIQGGINEKDTK
jgi:hypothetical protein